MRLRDLSLKMKPILAVVAVAALSLGGCSYVSTDRIEGVVRNAVTKEPIPNVVVNIGWGASQPGIVDSSRTGLRHKTVISDESGRYFIEKANFFVAMYKQFDEISMSAFHPLYVMNRWHWPLRYDRGEIKSYRSIQEEYGKEGTIHYDIELMHIEDRFSTGKDLNDFSRYIDGERASYYMKLKEQFGLRYNLDELEKSYQRVKEKISPTEEIRRLEKLMPELKQLQKEGY